MIKTQNKVEKSEQILRTILVLILAWILATWSKIFLEKFYCILKFYIETKSFGRPVFCELLPGFYVGTVLTAATTLVWFIFLMLIINKLKNVKF